MSPDSIQGYSEIQAAIVTLLETARRAVARSINAAMTATYWEIGRHIVEFEQGGDERAAYGDALVQRLAKDLTQRFGRGFSRQNLGQMRAFYRAWPAKAICQTLSGKSSLVPVLETLSSAPAVGVAGWRLLRETNDLSELAKAFPLPWSAYVRLLSVSNELARQFYETSDVDGQYVNLSARSTSNSTSAPRCRGIGLRCWRELSRPRASTCSLPRRPSKTRLSSNSLI